MIETNKEDEFEKQFDIFLKKWCPQSYPHLIDTDENDGQLIRDIHKKAVRDAEKQTALKIRKWLENETLFVCKDYRFDEEFLSGEKE